MLYWRVAGPALVLTGCVSSSTSVKAAAGVRPARRGAPRQARPPERRRPPEQARPSRPGVRPGMASSITARKRRAARYTRYAPAHRRASTLPLGTQLLVTNLKERPHGRGRVKRSRPRRGRPSSTRPTPPRRAGSIVRRRLPRTHPCRVHARALTAPFSVSPSSRFVRGSSRRSARRRPSGKT
jgi:hypothetical protein